MHNECLLLLAAHKGPNLGIWYGVIGCEVIVLFGFIYVVYYCTDSKMKKQSAHRRENNKMNQLSSHVQPHTSPSDREVFVASSIPISTVYDQAFPDGPPPSYSYSFLVEKKTYAW